MPRIRRVRSGILFGVAVWSGVACQQSVSEPPRVPSPETVNSREIREALLEELKPVALQNCVVRRFGSAYDGGYLLCENLLQAVESAYSYGIDREDNWGCEITERLGVPVHQYDCFTPHRPACPRGRVFFHDECVGPKTETLEAGLFDTLTNQIAKNGDREKRLLLKIDVEGAEWDSLGTTSQDVLNQMDQIAMEFHGVNEPRFLEVVRKLKQTFHLVSVHFNNRACSPGEAPLPGWAYQALWVNKRIGVLDPAKPGRVPGSPPDAPDDPHAPDCQPK